MSNKELDIKALETLVMGFENNFSAIPQICERIEKIESAINRDKINTTTNSLWCNEIENRLNIIENSLIKQVGILGNALNDISNATYRENKTPHKCPVCDGKGKISKEPIYSLSADHYKPIDQRHLTRTVKQCESCEGKGIVWG